MADIPTRVLIVDDTVTYRKIIADVLAGIPGIEVVGTAPNGQIALQKIENLHPDILTLDLEMPIMGGLDVLRHLQRSKSDVGAIMLSAFTKEGAETTMEALSLGAFDFVLKPSGALPGKNIEQLRHELRPKIEAFARTRQIRRLLGGGAPAPPRRTAAAAPAAGDIHQRMQRIARQATGKPEAVVIGISTGGPQALTKMIPQLPTDLPVPVLIVQHMPPLFTKSLADDLNRRSRLTVCEAVEGQPVLPGFVFIAPGGKQMRIIRDTTSLSIQITDDPPENSCKPSADYLFRSASHVLGGNVLGVIMTGMGYDGSQGCRLLKRCGAPILCQDEASCVVFGMPRQPIEEELADVVAPLDRIAEEITRMVGKGVAACK
ncbi:MAG: chemotaxis response regulator protein-glutamate methylesterase [Pirellulales bacterium]|nr:chemotaxis response regulator protein-glutamate methylesterase [Pirellulales bacterium]